MKRKALNAVAISSVLLLALSACGSDSETTNTTPDTQDNTNVSDNTATYTIGDTTTAEPAQEVRIEMPDELIEANQYYADHRAVDAITIRAADVPDAQCGVEIEFDYATGAIEELDKYEYQRIKGDLSLENRPEPYKYQAAVYMNATYFEESGYGFNNDHTLYTSEIDCAVNPSDTDASSEVEFRAFEWKDVNEIYEDNIPSIAGEKTPPPQYDGAKGIVHDTLAEVEYTVMANGDIQIINASVDGWTQDSNGMWLED